MILIKVYKYCIVIASYIIISSTFNAFAQQKESDDLDNLLQEFYLSVQNQKYEKGLSLSKSIDSLLNVCNSLDEKSLAIYYNSKGFIYYFNKLNPEDLLIKADSLNNLLEKPEITITMYSPYILGEYYFESNQESKAKEAFSKIIDLENIPEKYLGLKLKALERYFLIERKELSKGIIDSTKTALTANTLIDFKRLINDTLNISFGMALDFLNKKNNAEQIFLDINNIPKRSDDYDKYSRFQALNWLNNLYYKRINNNIKDVVNAKKLIEVSEELLSVIDNSDFLELHHIYSIYGDIVLASLIVDDKIKQNYYENKILKLLENNDYLNDKNLDLKRFYYTLHKLKIYYELDRYYQKAKYYAKKNVEIKKFLHGKFSVEHEQELDLYNTIVQLKLFDYDEAINIISLREDIIKSLYGINSKEYLDILFKKYSISLNKFEFEKGLVILENAMRIIPNVECTDIKICRDIKLSYLQSLNSTEQYKKTLENIEKLKFDNDLNTLLEISSIKRNAYLGLNDFLSLNSQFENTLKEMSKNKQALITSSSLNIYSNFLFDYQQYLASKGRIKKAISILENNAEILNNQESSFNKNRYLMQYLSLLMQNSDCLKALNIIEKNTLEFSDITTPSTKAFQEYQFNSIVANIYSCLDEYEKASEYYIKALSYTDSTKKLIYIQLVRIFRKLQNESKSAHYLKKLNNNILDFDALSVEELLLLSDLMIERKDRNMLIKYLLPLSRKVIDQICNQSFYSSSDNKTTKLSHDFILKQILSNNHGDLYNPDLAINAIDISSLYKEKLNFYTIFNIEIQKLKKDGHPAALKLQNLEKEYNKNPTEVIKEEIAQVKTYLNTIIDDKSNYLCDFNHNDIYNSINQNELLVNIMSYVDKFGDEKYAANLYSKNLSIMTSLHLESFINLQNKDRVSTSFFYDIKKIVKAKNGNPEMLDTFYIVPSGKSNRINFNAYSLTLEENNSKTYKVHTLNSITDLSKIKAEKNILLDNLILVGDIDYDNSLTFRETKKPINQTRQGQLLSNIKDSDILYWGYLPGTKNEIEQINEIAVNKNLKTSIYNGVNATTKNIQNSLSTESKTKIIHFATHGFFFPNISENKSNNFFVSHENPLLRSGLILSGANENWNKKSLSNTSADGILTAEEISFMDFSNVNLVVLSACDTGLGDISNLDGVIGLQSAFKLAGADKLIMSLWKVPDKETAEFFEYFYRYLLVDKLSINDSFRKTQRLMKEKYTPYYWAAFVLIE